jgi:type VI secretion system protein ImpG
VKGLGPVVRTCEGLLEIVFLLKRPAPELAAVTAADLALHATPVVNLFERDCNLVEIDPRRTRQAIYADRTRPRDFEIHRVLKVEDADADGIEAEVPALFSLGQNRGSGWAWYSERRPRRPTDDERLQGQSRTSYAGDDVFLSVSRSPGAQPARPLRRASVMALCSNRDLPILDDAPTLSLETGDPVDGVQLFGSLRPPRPAIPATLPLGVAEEARADDLAWRLVSQLSLNFLSLAEEGRGADPLHALLDLYADRGDPSLARHVRAITRITSRPVVERLPVSGPLCFGRGTELTLHVDQSVLAGHSALLLTALLAQLFARYAAINAFVRTRTHLVQKQEDVPWPMTPGNRYLI